MGVQSLRTAVSWCPHHSVQLGRSAASAIVAVVWLILFALCYATSPQQARQLPYEFMLEEMERDRGMAYMGSLARMRRAFSQALAGNKIKVVVTGGSIAAGVGALKEGKSFSKWASEWIERALPGMVEWVTDAQPSTTTNYMSLCVETHVPLDTNIVIVEYSVNNAHASMVENFNAPHTRSHERLLRKLLGYPRRPAVVLLNSFHWRHARPFPGAYSGGSTERDSSELSTFYDVPSLSLKACCYHLLKSNARPGFWANTSLYELPQNISIGEKMNYFFADAVHPWGLTGHRVLGDLIVHLFRLTMASLEAKAYNSSMEEEAYVNAPLPPPVIPQNYEVAVSRCFVKQFPDVVVEAQGFNWTDESKGHGHHRWGYVGWQPGSFLRVKVNTTAATGDSPDKLHMASVQLAYLMSYEHMGIGVASCESGCTCNTTAFDEHFLEHYSLMKMLTLKVSQGSECTIRVTISNSTTSGETKVKLMGVIVSEEAGQAGGAEIEYAIPLLETMPTVA